MDTVAAVSIEQLIDMLIACVIFTALTASMMLLNDVSSLQEGINANIAVVDDYIVDAKFSEKVVYAQDIIALFMEVQGKTPIELCGTTYVKNQFNGVNTANLTNPQIKEADFFNLATLQDLVDYSKKYYAYIVYDKYRRLHHYVITEYDGSTVPNGTRQLD